MRKNTVLELLLWAGTYLLPLILQVIWAVLRRHWLSQSDLLAYADPVPLIQYTYSFACIANLIVSSAVSGKFNHWSWVKKVHKTTKSQKQKKEHERFQFEIRAFVITAAVTCGILLVGFFPRIELYATHADVYNIFNRNIRTVELTDNCIDRIEIETHSGARHGTSYKLCLTVFSGGDKKCFYITPKKLQVFCASCLSRGGTIPALENKEKLESYIKYVKADADDAAFLKSLCAY